MPADEFFSLTMTGFMKVSGLRQIVPEPQTAKTQRIKWRACADYKPHLLHSSPAAAVSCGLSYFM